MKKLFQRMDQGSREPGTSHTSYIGKVFVMGRHTVTVEDTIAEGGFALVFLVKGSGGSRYALKRLCVNNEHDLQVARNEINILKSLSGGRTVVSLLDCQVTAVGSTGVHEVLMLMTYYKRPLLHLLNERLGVGLTEAEVLRIFCDVCDAVSRLHQSSPPVIHRDLKVENILCGPDSYVLCDFGSATTLSVCPTACAGGVAAVEEELQRYTTLPYRAPEMVDLYAGKTISTKADIWALGCLLYKLCFFSLPFGESPLAITSGSFFFPTDCPVKYSPGLLAFIRYLLTPCPDTRPDIYQTSGVAARLAGQPSTVLSNLNNSVIPSEEQLLALLRASGGGQSRGSMPPAPAPFRAQHTPHAEPGGTSVAPRQRPKPQQHVTSSSSGGAMPPLQPPPHPTPTPPPTGAPNKRYPPIKDDQQQQPPGADTKQSPPQQQADHGSPVTSFPPAELFVSGYPASASAAAADYSTEVVSTTPTEQQQVCVDSLAAAGTVSPQQDEDMQHRQLQQQQCAASEGLETFFPLSGYPDPFTSAVSAADASDDLSLCPPGWRTHCVSSDSAHPDAASPLSPIHQQHLLLQQQYHHQQQQQCQQQYQQQQYQQSLVLGLQQLDFGGAGEPMSQSQPPVPPPHGPSIAGDSGAPSPLSPSLLQLQQHFLPAALTTSSALQQHGVEHNLDCSPAPPERTTSLHRRMASEPTSRCYSFNVCGHERTPQQQQPCTFLPSSHQQCIQSGDNPGQLLLPDAPNSGLPLHTEMTEDHIFGAEFDRIRRRPHGPDNYDGGGNVAVPTQEEDPFGAAPFHGQSGEGEPELDRHSAELEQVASAGCYHHLQQQQQQQQHLQQQQCNTVDTPEHLLLAASPPNMLHQQTIVSSVSESAPTTLSAVGVDCVPLASNNNSESASCVSAAATTVGGGSSHVAGRSSDTFPHDNLVISPPPSFCCGDFVLPPTTSGSRVTTAAAAATAAAVLATAATTAAVVATITGGNETVQADGTADVVTGIREPGEELDAGAVLLPTSLFTRPPLEDRSKYEKFQNLHDESDDEKEVLKQDCQLKFPRSAIKRLKSGKSVRTTTKIGADGKPESVFVCVSDDDSIGSASDLKERINDEYEDYGGAGQGAGVERGGEDVSETVSSSVYHAECESVTTHEEDPRITGTTDPSAAIRRGPKPSRASIKAKASAKLEQEKKKANNPDRLLGHEYGEKPLLLDDELDSGDDEDKVRLEKSKTEYQDNDDDDDGGATTRNSEANNQAALINLQSPPPPSLTLITQADVIPSAPPAEDEELEEDVFALAPFKKPPDNLNILQSQNNNTNTTGIAYQQSKPCLPRQLPSTTDTISGQSNQMISVDIIDALTSDLVRRPVQTHIIYEESPSEDFPIYENVTLNQSCPVPESEDNHNVYNRPLMLPAVKNPFTNPFFHGSSPLPQIPDTTNLPLPLVSLESQSSASSKDVMSQSVDSLTFSQHVNPVALNKTSSHSSTDLFGSTPFGFLECGAKPASSNLNENVVRSAVAQTPANTSINLHTEVTPRPKQSHYYSPPTDTPIPYHAITSTPRNNNKATVSPSSKPLEEDGDDEDLFGAVPFKPIFASSQRSFLGLKSRTLPANMSSSLQSQLNQMSKDEGVHTQTDIFKAASKSGKKMTPPSFRKPRLSHQILSSDSESSTDSLESGNAFTIGATSSKKSKHRDRSKDRLKYKNIREEFEEENTMVLPMKQFSLSKKEKHTKKHKKQDKIEKLEKKLEKNEKKFEKAEKKAEKLEKKSEKPDKKDKLDKKLEKAEKKADKSDKRAEKPDKTKTDKKCDKNQSYEPAGISNMSFEDQAVDDARNRLTTNCSRNSQPSPDEDDDDEAADLRTTGGHRFGSLKRGINPFSKLSGRI